MITCKATQYSDQMFCDRCGLVWDTNDPDPPACVTDKQIKERLNKTALEQYGIKKGVLVVTPNGNVYEVSSFKPKELSRPSLKGYKRLRTGKFAKRSSEIHGSWELLSGR